MRRRGIWACLLKNLTNYFWPHWVFAAAHWLSLVAVQEFLIVVASLVVEHGL